jgi:hypothetical protein
LNRRDWQRKELKTRFEQWQKQKVRDSIEKPLGIVRRIAFEDSSLSWPQGNLIKLSRGTEVILAPASPQFLSLVVDHHLQLEPPRRSPVEIVPDRRTGSAAARRICPVCVWRDGPHRGSMLPRPRSRPRRSSASSADGGSRRGGCRARGQYCSCNYRPCCRSRTRRCDADRCASASGSVAAIAVHEKILL